MVTETADMTAADIEKRLTLMAGKEGDENATQASDTPQENDEEGGSSSRETGDDSPDYDDETNEGESQIDALRSEVNELKQQLKASGSREDMELLSNLNTDPLGVIRAIAEAVAEGKLKEKIDPLYADRAVEKSNSSWKEFTKTLEESGIEITPELDKAIAAEINKLPKLAELIKIDSQFKDPNAILEYAYFKASKKIKPRIKQKAKEPTNNRTFVEGAGKAKTKEAGLDIKSMPLKDLEQLIGIAEEK